MRFLFVSFYLLLVSSTSYGALSEKFKLTNSQYSVRVKPYLNSLNNDFYEMLFSFRPGLGAIKEISRNNIKIKRELHYMSKSCQDKVFVRCQASLKNLENLTTANHKLIQQLKNSDYCSIVANKKCAFAVSIMKELYLVSLKAKLNLGLATLSHAPKVKWPLIEKELGEMRTLSQSFVTQSFPDSNNQDFQLIWGNFFKVVEDLFLIGDDAKLFQAWVDRLNFSMNEFLLSLSNKEKTLPSGLKLKADTMHAKWNLMLKEHL